MRGYAKDYGKAAQSFTHWRRVLGRRHHTSSTILSVVIVLTQQALSLALNLHEIYSYPQKSTTCNRSGRQRLGLVPLRWKRPLVRKRLSVSILAEERVTRETRQLHIKPSTANVLAISLPWRRNGLALLPASFHDHSRQKFVQFRSSFLTPQRGSGC